LKDVVIIAPHCDDEIIGTFETLISPSKKIIIYSEKMEFDHNRKDYALELDQFVSGISEQVFSDKVPNEFLSNDFIYYVPDPYFEIHPDHRYWGSLFEKYARDGLDVIFYSTIMNAPYIHEVKEPEKKLHLLNCVYPDQRDLWLYDHKYFLFEGYTKWIF